MKREDVGKYVFAACLIVFAGLLIWSVSKRPSPNSLQGGEDDKWCKAASIPEGYTCCEDEVLQSRAKRYYSLNSNVQVNSNVRALCKKGGGPFALENPKDVKDRGIVLLPNMQNATDPDKATVYPACSAKMKYNFDAETSDDPMCVNQDAAYLKGLVDKIREGEKSKEFPNPISGNWKGKEIKIYLYHGGLNFPQFGKNEACAKSYIDQIVTFSNLNLNEGDVSSLHMPEKGVWCEDEDNCYLTPKFIYNTYVSQLKDGIEAGLQWGVKPDFEFMQEVNNIGEKGVSVSIVDKEGV